MKMRTSLLAAALALGFTAAFPMVREALAEDAKPAQTQPSEGFVASAMRDIFHKPDCDMAKKISDKNRVTYKTRDEAVEAGKKPCKQCKP